VRLIRANSFKRCFPRTTRVLKLPVVLMQLDSFTNQKLK
jgi:hypothetical protein